MLGVNMTAVLIFTILCLMLFSFVVYMVYREMQKEDKTIHALARVERRKGSLPDQH